MNDFWLNKKVLVTGSFGFKGLWLSLILHRLGAEVTGFSLRPSTNPVLSEICGLEKWIKCKEGDVRDFINLEKFLIKTQPEIIFHLASQPLVIEGYKNPYDTYDININGTLNVIKATKRVSAVRTIINVTTDKVYKNTNTGIPFVENDALGGDDPYSSSKACSDLLTNCLYKSTLHTKNIGVATARAGNVIGGGDWAGNRLIPDAVRSIIDNKPLIIRNPYHTRPWQHVLIPISGYLKLAKKLNENPTKYSGPWNFGPKTQDCKSVKWVIDNFSKIWHLNYATAEIADCNFNESKLLTLDISKSKKQLGWEPAFDLRHGLKTTAAWYKKYYSGEDPYKLVLNEIESNLDIFTG